MKIYHVLGMHAAAGEDPTITRLKKIWILLAPAALASGKGGPGYPTTFSNAIDIPVTKLR